MLESFIDLMNEVEPMLGKFVGADGMVEETYPIKAEGMYIDVTINVQFDTKKLMLKLYHNKYGSEMIDVITYENSDDVVGTGDNEEMILDLIYSSDIDIVDLAYELYHVRFLEINRTIDRTGVTDDDIEYLQEMLLQVTELKKQKKVD